MDTIETGGRIGPLRVAEVEETAVGVAMRVLVCSPCQTGLDRLVQASTTTVALVPHEIAKPNPLLGGARFWALLRINGHGAVRALAKIGPQPLVPGKK